MMLADAIWMLALAWYLAQVCPYHVPYLALALTLSDAGLSLAQVCPYHVPYLALALTLSDAGLVPGAGMPLPCPFPLSSPRPHPI